MAERPYPIERKYKLTHSQLIDEFSKHGSLDHLPVYTTDDKKLSLGKIVQGLKTIFNLVFGLPLLMFKFLIYKIIRAFY